MNRLPTFAARLAAGLCLLVATSALASDRFPLRLTIHSADGGRIEGVAVTVTRTAGEPFTAQGVTNKKGRFEHDLPDFSSVYAIRAEKAGLVTVDQELNPAAAGIQAGQTADVSLTMVEPTAQYYYGKGREALLARDLDRAIQLMGESVALDSGFVDGWRALSSIYLAASRPAEALSAADTTLTLAPDDARALRNRFDALAALGRSEELDAALDALVVHDASRETAILLFNRGTELLKLEDSDGARGRFGQALEIDPDLHQAHSALAEVAIGEAERLEGEARAAKLDEALAHLDRAIAIAPRNFKALDRKVEILQALGRADEAAEVEKQIAALRSAG